MHDLPRRAPTSPFLDFLAESRKPGFAFRPDDLRRFLEACLAYGSELLSAVGAAAWRLDRDELTVLAGHRYQESESTGDDERQERHRSFLLAAALGGQCRCLGPGDPIAGVEFGNPTEFTVVVAPLVTAERLVGVLEFFLKGDPDDLRGWQQIVTQLKAFCEEFLLRCRFVEQERQKREFGENDAFSLAVHASLEADAVAYTAANELRRVLDLDRVSVALYRRGTCRVAAVSGQDQFDSRSNVVRALARLATLAARTSEPIECDLAVGDVAPEIREALYDYFEQTHAKQVLVVPLKTPAGEKGLSPTVVGAVVAEGLQKTSPMVDWRPRLERLSKHAGSAAANALDCEWPLFAPVGRVLRRSRLWRTTRNTRISALVLFAVLLAAAVLTFYPVDFALESPGKLQPVTRREVFAEVEGTVREVYVRHGQRVTKGMLLAELVNHDLNVAQAEVQKQISETEQEVANTDRELNDAQRASAVDRGKITARRATAVERLAGLRSQDSLYSEKRRRLRVVSPIDGRVATWNVAETLTLRPVQQGHLLLTIVDPDAEWELELRVPEQRAGHVLEARRKLSELPVTFLVAADPYRTYAGRVREIHLGADVRDEEEGNTVLVRAEITDERPPQLNPGGEVRAKILCGSRPLGYVWFHEVYEFVQSQILFRL